MSNGYTATLKGGEKIFIADWTPSVALQNLTSAGKYIGIDNLLAISKLADNATHIAVLALTDAEDAAVTMELIKDFVTSANMDGERIESHNFDSTFTGRLNLVTEIFCHVVHSQYASFFDSELIEV